MEAYTVQVTWTNGAGYRFGEYATIIGIQMVVPTGLEPRLCYVVKYSDGFIDYIPISEASNLDFKAIT